jgi:hypothetical protein
MPYENRLDTKLIKMLNTYLPSKSTIFCRIGILCAYVYICLKTIKQLLVVALTLIFFLNQERLAIIHHQLGLPENKKLLKKSRSFVTLVGPSLSDNKKWH